MVSFFIANINPGYLFIVVPVFFLSGYYNFNLLKNQAKQRAKQTALAEMIRTAITIIVPLAAVLFVKNLYALPVLFASLLLAYASGLLYLSKKENNNAQAEQQELPDISIIKKQIREYGIPIAFFVSVSLALTVNDRYLIAHLMDYKSSGNYGALYDLLNKGVGFSCAPVIMTYFPHIVKQFNGGNKAGAYSSIKKALLLEAIIFITGLACLALFGKFFFELFLKHTVGNDTMQLAYILYTGVFVWQAAMLVHKPLELRLQTRYMAIGVFIAFAVNITANYFLIKQYHDVMMAAWTTLGSSLLYLFFIIFIIFAKKKADKTNGILHN